MINIALLKSKRAIYIKRATEIVKNAEEVVFRFQDNKTDQVPDGLTAIFFKENGQSLYRDILNSQCVVPAKFLHGATQIRVADIANWKAEEVWDTETLIGKDLDGLYLVLEPVDVDVAKEIMANALELDKARVEISALTEKINKTNERLTKAFEGWDII
jgi:hypothetical protein